MGHLVRALLFRRIAALALLNSMIMAVAARLRLKAGRTGLSPWSSRMHREVRPT